MKTHVMTLMWGDAWTRYGKRFYDSFIRHWPSSIGLTIVTDRFLDEADQAQQILLRDVEGWKKFYMQYGAEDYANGKVKGKKLDADGVSWRHNAMLWYPQALAPYNSGLIDTLPDGDIFVWMDADVHTTRQVPEKWVERLIGASDLACLQRPGQHSEIGFYAVNLSPVTRAFLAEFAGIYTSGRVFDYPEWHSAYIFDRAAERRLNEVAIRNLNTQNKRGHCWPDTVLAQHTVHKKGKRKDTQ